MAGAKVEVINDRLSIRLEGWGKIWALKGRVEVPLAAVQTVEAAPAGIKPRGLRAPGSYWPGLIAAGTYRRRHGKELWSARNAAKAIVIEVDDPAATIALLRAALDRTAPAAAG